MLLSITMDISFTTDLWFDYLRSRPGVEEQVPVYRIEVLLLTNDAPVAVPFLAQLEAKGFIEGVNPVFTRWTQLEYRKDQTSIFVETLKKLCRGSGA